MISNRKIDFQKFIESNKLRIIAMTAIAPFVTIYLGLMALYKSAINIANKLFFPRNCKTCTNRSGNGCNIYDLAIKPHMMCKGTFYVENTVPQNTYKTSDNGSTAKRKDMNKLRL